MARPTGRARIIAGLILALTMAGCGAPMAAPGAALPRPSPMPTAAPARTGAALPRPSPMPTASPTRTDTALPRPSPTPTASPTRTDTALPRPSPTPTASPGAALPRPSIVIISIDGLRPDALQQTAAPHLLGLAQGGAYTFQAQTIFPPVTLPAHASMLTGQPPEVHGMDWNDYQPERGPLVTAPTVFAYAHQAGLRTGLVVGKEKLKHFDVPDSVDVYVFVATGDQDVANQAIVQAQDVDLLFVHLPNTDFFGHSTGWLSGVYLFQLTRTDEAVGRLLAALPPETTIIVTADHGGHGQAHGQNIPEDMTIPWIIAGPGVKTGHALAGLVSIMDTAATALYVLGLPQPAGLTGRPVLDAFASPPP